jgi:hypothetical protein
MAATVGIATETPGVAAITDENAAVSALEVRLVEDEETEETSTLLTLEMVVE